MELLLCGGVAYVPEELDKTNTFYLQAASKVLQVAALWLVSKCGSIELPWSFLLEEQAVWHSEESPPFVMLHACEHYSCCMIHVLVQHCTVWYTCTVRVVQYCTVQFAPSIQCMKSFPFSNFEIKNRHTVFCTVHSLQTTVCSAIYNNCTTTHWLTGPVRLWSNQWLMSDFATRHEKSDTLKTPVLQQPTAVLAG